MKATIKIGLTCAVVVVGVLAYGREQTWTLVFGPPDLGPVDFAMLKPPSSPNHYLVCPEGLCAQAQADMVSPTYPLSATQLQAATRKAWAAEPRLEMVDSDPEARQDRYVQRTAFMRFPDTISVRFIDQEAGKATLAIYSRSQIGHSDLGVNKARVLRWLALLKAGAGNQ